MECINCGESLRDSATFCPRCGLSVTPSPAPAPDAGPKPADDAPSGAGLAVMDGDVDAGGAAPLPGDGGSALEVRAEAAGIDVPGSPEPSEDQDQGAAAGSGDFGGFSGAGFSRSRRGAADQESGGSLGSDFSDWGEDVSSSFSKKTQAEIDAGTNIPASPTPSQEQSDDAAFANLLYSFGRQRTLLPKKNDGYYGKGLSLPMVIILTVVSGPLLGYMIMAIMSILLGAEASFEDSSMGKIAYQGGGCLLAFIAFMKIRHDMKEDQKPYDPLHPYD